MRTRGGLSAALRSPQTIAKRFLVFVLDAVADEPGVAEVGGGDDDVGFAVHEAFADPAMPNEFLDRDDRDVVLPGDLAEFIVARHVERGLAADFDERPDRPHAGHLQKIDGGFGMAGPAEDAAFFRQQRIDVPGPLEFPGERFWGRSACEL